MRENKWLEVYKGRQRGQGGAARERAEEDHQRKRESALKAVDRFGKARGKAVRCRKGHGDSTLEADWSL